MITEYQRIICECLNAPGLRLVILEKHEHETRHCLDGTEYHEHIRSYFETEAGQSVSVKESGHPYIFRVHTELKSYICTEIQK